MLGEHPTGLIEGFHPSWPIHHVFLWLPSPDKAVVRVAARVREGGHAVPEETIRRRYEAGLHNFFRLYQPMATSRQFWDNSKEVGLVPIATGEWQTTSHVSDQMAWEQVKAAYVT